MKGSLVCDAQLLKCPPCWYKSVIYINIKTVTALTFFVDTVYKDNDLIYIDINTVTVP